MRAFFGSSEDGARVSVSKNGVILSACAGDRAADLLELLEAALKKAKVKKTSLTEIVVDKGPDGFSSVRRRVAVATALARALNAALYGADACTPEEAAALPSRLFAAKAAVQPVYAGAPNITASKKKRTWNAR